MRYLMDVATLREKLFDENVIILDARSNLARPDDGYYAYMEEHIVGAQYIHLEKDLSGEVRTHGGNHPLPDVETFSKKLRQLGVNNDSTVVVYDEGNEMFAPRAWFVLRYVGIENVYVLQGGFRAWKHATYPVTSETKERREGNFTPNVQHDLIITMEEVRDRNMDTEVLLDARAKNRYLGKTEPLYDKAGHIPGAKNFFWADILDEDGNWKSKEALQAHFANLKEYDTIIASCGSGISACPNVLALQIAGFDDVKLYVGSFSDWISYEENDIETKES